MAEAFGVAPHMNSEIGISDIRVCLQTMREVENSGRVFDAGSGYVKHRRLLVDWICECGDSHSLANSTSHVAVGLMDKVLQAVDVKRDRYQMVALTCLVLAAKYEEKEESVPSMRRLYEYVEKRQGQKAAQMCEAHRVNNMEVLILNTLGWKITIVTPLHYLGVFERMGVVYSSDTLGYKPLLPKIVRYMKKYMHFFADLCLQDYAFHMWSPSLLAAALVVASRKALNIRPLWSSPAMDSSLGYSFAAVAPVFQAVWAHYKGQFPREAGEAMELEAETDAEQARAAAAVAAAAAAAAAAASASAAAAVMEAAAATTAAAAAEAASGPFASGSSRGVSLGELGGGTEKWRHSSPPPPPLPSTPSSPPWAAAAGVAAVAVSPWVVVGVVCGAQGMVPPFSLLSHTPF